MGREQCFGITVVNRRYIIGTGYVDNSTQNGQPREELMKYWLRNNRDTASPRAQFVMSMFGSTFHHPDVKEINVVGNLGHYTDLLDGWKSHTFSGAAVAILTLALVAYADESDFIYKEQDSLAFGPWIDHLYDAIGDDGGACLGPYEPAPSGTALMLFRHWAIPTIVSRYLAMRAENNAQSLVEHHFHEMAANDPVIFRYYTMGYDKRRPVNFDDRTFWLQQPTPEEIKTLKQKHLL